MLEIKSLQDSLGVKKQKFSQEKLDEMVLDLKVNDQAMSYLQKDRGLSIETIEHFRLGYNKKLDAIAIPLYRRNELIAIKYRYLNPVDETRYTSEKGGQNWIYNEDGVDIGRSKGKIIIVEGEFDCMSMWQAGFKNVVSPASGKDSYGVWIELLDTIPSIYIAYDNDDGGRGASVKMAERLGTDKCFEVVFPDNTKDANEYFKKYTAEHFKVLGKTASPFYKYEFKGVGDIIESLRYNREEVIELKCIPKVKFEKDWIGMISGVSNAGKTSYVLNIADELTQKNIPTLVMPFERGIDSVGKRFLQVKFNKTIDEFSYMNSEEWDGIIKECVDTPVFFALPKRNEIISTIIKSKRLFDTRVVIIDHLDYIIRNVQGNKEAEIGNTLQALKRVAEENKVLILIVTHVRKVETGHSALKRKPSMEDLKGSSSLYQDPEVVVMIDRPEENILNVNVLKNKGDMVERQFEFNFKTGRVLGEIDEFGLPEVKLPKELNEKK